MSGRRFKGFGLLALVPMLVVTTSIPPAYAGGGDGQIDYKLQQYLCEINDDGTVNLGGGVYMMEIGKTRVTRLQVEYVVYRTNVGSGWNPAYIHNTLKSAEFPNDRRSYWWDGATGSYHVFHNLSAVNSYRLEIKMRWLRPWRPDWTRKLAVTATCN